MTDALTAALDAAAQPVRFFIRDDDAGWADARLHALLATLERVGAAVDLAVIPTAVEPALAAELRARHDAAPARLGLHQHGFAHSNHEPIGRKCEFGNARTPSTLQRDLREGRERLVDAFGTRLDAIFTPPWNRCSEALPALLAAGAWRALSRESRARPQDKLPELPVHVDWCRCWRDARAAGSDPLSAVAQALARHARAGAPVGLMLHHGAMDDAELDVLGDALARWQLHPHARWARMNEWLSKESA